MKLKNELRKLVDTIRATDFTSDYIEGMAVRSE
jgi:hypothetical protein